jgi:DNA-binding response OmpR family regulator
MSPERATILIVEDDRATQTFLGDNLVADGYELLAAATMADAGRRLARSYPDLMILDLGLPDGDGLELIAEIRGADRHASPIDPELPLLVLSGRGAELDRLRGFERGCDDYLVKPFSYAELRVRVEALLRRTRVRPRSGRIRVGPLALDAISRQVWLDGRQVWLSNKEFALLRALAAEPTRVFTREELLRGVWGYEEVCATRTLDSHASRLRQKLSGGGHKFVVNVWGVGFRLIDGAL